MGGASSRPPHGRDVWNALEVRRNDALQVFNNNNMTNRKESVNQHPLAVTARSIANWIFDCKAECGVKYINIFVFVFVFVQ